MSTEIAIPDGREIQNAVMKAQIEAKMLVVNSPESYRMADVFCVQIAERENKVKDNFAKSKQAAFLAHREICAQEKGHLDGWAEIRKTLKGKMDKWRVEEEIRRLQEEEKQREINRKLAEEAAQAQALEAERLGEKALAEAIINQTVISAPPIVKSEIPKIETRIRYTWRARIVNPLIIPDEFWDINEQKLNARARETKGTAIVPGVEFYSEIS